VRDDRDDALLIVPLVVEGADPVGRTEIRARVFEGSPSEAETYSLYVNAQHG
jgi:hypothetical protein